MKSSACSRIELTDLAMPGTLYHLSDLSDPRLDAFRDLPRTNLTRYAERFVVEGRALVHRLAASRFPVESVVTSQRYVDDLPERLSAEVPVWVLPHRELDKLIGFRFHRGMLAAGRRLPGEPLTAVWRRAEQAGSSLWCVCARLVDPTNLGCIVRNAAALGVAALLLGPGSADPFSRRAIRVSMGAVLELPVVELPDLPATLHWMRHAAGIELIGTVLDARAEPLPAARRAAHTALIFGPEADCRQADWHPLCDRRVTLPMAWETDSLNVAAATAVFLYHFAHIAPTG